MANIEASSLGCRSSVVFAALSAASCSSVCGSAATRPRVLSEGDALNAFRAERRAGGAQPPLSFSVSSSRTLRFPFAELLGLRAQALARLRECFGGALSGFVQ